MKSDTPLDYAVFQLSPRRSRCELFVSSAGNTEKLASGLVKPFVSHLKVAEEQVALAVQSIKLEVERRKNAETWFTKGTLERFVRFVSTPEVLELVNTYDAEMSQLEAARRIYSQGAGDQLAGTLSGDGVTAAADATKKELLKAIDVRLVAVRQDLTTACARAEAAGFTPDTISELQLFADQFGAGRLNEACNKFISVCERRPDLINPWKAGVDDRAVRSSCGSDMSLDEDPTDDQPGCGPNHRHSAGREPNSTQQHFDPSKPSTWQQPTKPSSVVFPIRRSRESSVDREDSKEKKDEIVTQNEPTQPTQPARRLSVQDRINLFENKQKESSGGGGGGSGGKPAVAKSAELRRLSSDVSSAPTVAAEKAVLRRWSGASDMSIDLGGENKDIENPLFTPSSSSVSQTKSEEQNALNDRADSQVRAGQEEVVETKVGLKPGTQLTTNDSESNKLTSTLGRVGSGDWKDRTRGKTQTQTLSRSSFGSAGDESLRDQVSSQTQFTPLPGGIAEQIGLTEQRRFKGSFSGNKRGGIEEQVVAGEKDQAVPQTQLGAEGVGSRGQSVSQFKAHPKTAVDSGQLEGGSGEKSGEAPAVQYKGIEGDSLASPSQWRSFGEVEEVGKKELGSSDKQPVNFTTKGEDSGLQRMKFQKQVSVSEQIKKSQGRREESLSDYRNSRPVFSGKMISEGQEDVGTVPAVSGEQAQRVRQSKGNQERNDELKMKANELEKLFAEHKLRVPGEQSSSARRNKPADMQIEQAVSFPYRKPPAETASAQLPDKNTVNEPLRGSSILSQFSVTPPMKTLDNQKNGDSLKQNFSELGLSDDSRGKFYERYIQKRDAKLREEWGSKRAEKEAKMKAMHDSFERSRAEMRAKFSGSAERQDSAFSARRRAERLRSFNTRSTLKREQHPIDLLQSEDEEDLSEFAEQIPIGHDRFFGETSLGDTASKNTQNKKLLPNKSLSSSTPRTSAVPVPRSAVKSSNPSSGRRRMQSENLLAQSVPNFSDLRKENTKPSSGVSKTATRPQARNYARSKSISEEIPFVKEEKPRRSQTSGKSTASPAEFKDLSSLDSEGIVLTPLKFDKEQTEHTVYDKFPKSVESKPFLRKGNGIGPGAGAVIAKMKASMQPENMNDEEESDELAFEPEESVDEVKDEEEEESEMITEDHASMDNGKPRLSQESDKLLNSGSESGDALRSFSQVDPSFVSELPAAVPSTFHPADSVQDSPTESPVSWNSRMQHAFSYAHETSDVDASADSPMGSPASWNSHSLNQAEADAARMRKKWGSAQKPVLVSNSSHSHSRKDMTKGFKRLLKFARKSRGNESLVDWISATTSEGDDDTEDGRDPANRSSEDLRKSRMGFSQGHPSDDSFNESEFYSEQDQALHSSIPAPPANFKLREDHLSGSSIKGPRSFFSLSSFRSKGNDSKPR
ncbi:uncharacterized protein LOC114305854 isoform X1 [Camellia sinensis]|uniref:uncharacterized protein LOC114305854 isoform X1 n=1 Tax=Camellia sinensis TaxID=4442 RepID=UPI001036A1A1|nr:uncharacterized protein LOC114305854 isoform X1 [Camellia sinensis]XP_028106787.1 uncharacterized protein LOC114305854 isoform X1 [Camellia sinensis]